jgi:hypothetical protein
VAVSLGSLVQIHGEEQVLGTLAGWDPVSHVEAVGVEEVGSGEQLDLLAVVEGLVELEGVIALGLVPSTLMCSSETSISKLLPTGGFLRS